MCAAPSSTTCANSGARRQRLKKSVPFSLGHAVRCPYWPWGFHRVCGPRRLVRPGTLTWSAAPRERAEEFFLSVPDEPAPQTRTEAQCTSALAPSPTLSKRTEGHDTRNFAPTRPRRCAEGAPKAAGGIVYPGHPHHFGARCLRIVSGQNLSYSFVLHSLGVDGEHTDDQRPDHCERARPEPRAYQSR